MSNQHLDLAAGFDPVSYDAWKTSLDKVLKGAPFDKRLVVRTAEGIDIQPLYTKDDAKELRSGLPGKALAGWDIRQIHATPGLRETNKAILDDLTRGVTSVELHLDLAAQTGRDGDCAPDLAGRGGAMVYTFADMDQVLKALPLKTIPISIKAGAAFLPAAANLLAVWEARKVAPADALGAFNADPLGELARTGELPQGILDAMKQMAGLARVTSDAHPNVTSVLVDTSPYYGAGASDAEDLACALATGVEYLRALTDSGLTVDQAAGEMVFSLPLGCDVFLGIAKLRAARLLWAKVLEHSGASEAARGMSLTAAMSRRVMSKRDPWVNMLRATATCFAGAVGGADTITLLPYDAALGISDDFARRIARNTQIVLQEESHLSRVIDPAGGAWYVENLTEQLASKTWEIFQEIEGKGGIVASLTDGKIAARLEATWHARLKDIARRKTPLTGVSEFPNLGETPPETAPRNYEALLENAKNRLAEGRNPQASLDLAASGGIVGAVKGGVSLQMLFEALGGSVTTIEALPAHRLAEDFEALRDAADAFKDKTGTWPQIFGANMGTVAQHTARATFARNYFEAGGIEMIATDGFTDPSTCAEAFKASGAKVAVLSGTDDLYSEQGPAFAAALKAAGCEAIYLAGKAGEVKEALEAVGVSGYIYMGSDVLETLASLHKDMGV